MLEKHIEAHLVARVKAKGGIAYKFTSPQRRSVPDRLVLLGLNEAGRIMADTLRDYGVIVTEGTANMLAEGVLAASLRFVELKAPGKKPTDMQTREHEKLRALGFTVEVIDSKEGVDALYPK